MKNDNANLDKNNFLSLEAIHDVACEKKVIASMISSPYALADCENILFNDCFYNLRNREIYKAICTIRSNGEIPDIITVNQELRRMESNLDFMQLATMVAETEIAYHVVPLALRLKELAYRRKLWEIGIKLIEGSCNEASELEMIHNSSKTSIDNLFENLDTGIETLEDSYKKVQDQMIINLSKEPGEIAGTPTGFYMIDQNGGLLGTDLIIIGADTSQGKTSLATALTISALKNSHGVAFYSMEMTPKQLAARIASMESGVNSKDILNSKLDIDQIYKIDHAMSTIDMSKLFFDGRSSSSLDSIITSIRQLKIKHDIKGAVVDYLQLVKVSDEKGLNREQQVAKAARDLKNLAKELNIWIIALSQLSRGDKTNSVPSMAQLRDSGQIEEAADTVILIYRPLNGRSFPAPFSDITTHGTALIKIEKGRNTGVGEFICGFKPQNTLFFPLTQDDIEKLKTGNQQIPDPFKDKRLSLEDDVPF